jgi:hypothetical protein
MKILALAPLLMASMAFVLLGCSDNSAPVVPPTDQPAPLKGEAPLAKVVVPNITGIEHPMAKVMMTHFAGIEHPTGLLNPGVSKIENGKMIVKGLVATASWEDGFDTFPLVKGTLVITANVELDMTTGEGPEYGTFTLTPDANVGGGVWEVRWEGYRYRLGASKWASKLVDVGYGKGGTIHGMKLFAKEVIHTTDLPGANPYVGDVKGTIESHHKGDKEGTFKSHGSGEREEAARELSDQF